MILMTIGNVSPTAGGVQTYLPREENVPTGSSFRAVFGSDHLKSDFAKFLKTIFYQLDEKKVFEMMGKILSDPSKSDQQIYEELVAGIDGMRKRFPALFHKLKALSVLQEGMGAQAAQLMRGFRGEEFHNYMEIYFRRYFETIKKTAYLALDGKVFDVSDKPYSGSIKERLEAGSLLSSYPYQTHVPLNDSDCKSPERQPEKTHKPIGEEAPDGSTDLIACLGGLHHIPKERVGAFVDSMFRKLKPGGVVLLRDHDVTTPSLWAIASVVHSFVNAADGVAWDVEKSEVREFHSAEYWTRFMEGHHFTRISPDNLILKDDPTQNGMMAFVRNPTNLSELQQAAQYRKDCVRSPDGTRATWIEWGNVRYSKQFAEFTQTRHAYAFDYIGHLKQHWNYFSSYITESRKDLPLRDMIFAGNFALTDNFAMNLFILVSTTLQCVTGYLGSVPNRVVARLRDGVEWRNATDLTALEKYEAQVEKEYAEYIDHTPFYMFPYLSKIRGLWTAIWNSNESKSTKLMSAFSATTTTLSLALKAAVCAPVRSMYTKNGQYVEPESVSILIHDPFHQFQTGERWIGGKAHHIKVIYQTPDGHKLVSIPRYRPFTELCKELASNGGVRLLQIGSQPKVTVDVIYKKGEETLHPRLEGLKVLYEMDKLQDAEQRRYATYQVNVDALADFERMVGVERIEYIHE